jgi:hypothetical protein
MKKVIRIVAIGLILVALHAPLTVRAEVKPVWTMVLSDPLLKDDGSPDQKRSFGIARWDETHVIVYSLTSTRNLVIRKQSERAGGSWAFSVQIIRSDNGEVVNTWSIPAESYKSELAVVAGGIVVSDRDHLVFYSRSFKQLDMDFVYTPIYPESRSQDVALSDPEHLYIPDDQKTFVLVDNKGVRSHFFLFDGTTFEKQSDWMLSGVNPQSIRIRDGRIIYGRLLSANQMSMTTDLYWTEVDGGQGAPRIMSTPSDDLICRIPVAVKGGTFLDTCGSIKIVKEQRSEIVYQPQKQEVVGTLIRISPDNHLAAILKYNYKGGGVLDLTERRTRVGLLIVNLEANKKTCEIPLMPIPRSQLAFTFASDSTLIVLNDGVVTAYKGLCSQ